jgi:group I intron endonuclease
LNNIQRRIKMGCIYGFADKEGKIFYVGQAKNLKIRVYGHAFEVRHGNKLHLYNKLRKIISESGCSVFSLAVVIEDNIDEEKLDEKEIFHIKRLRLEGYKLTNILDGGRRWLSGPSEEQRNKIRMTHLGRKRSPETRKRMSESQLGRKFSQEHKRKLSIARQKRIITDETRSKLSLSGKGKTNIKKYILTDPNGVEHVTTEGMTKFCEDHGLSTPNMHKVLTGARKNHKGWTIRNYGE